MTPRTFLLVAACLASFTTAHAQMPKEDVVDVPAIAEGLCVSNLFQTNMVLQRDKPIAVWGWAAPGEEVTVSFGGSEATAVAGDDRRWRAELAAVPVSHEPLQMTVAGATDTLVLENILVGDVWVLGGQSNMEFELAKVENGALEIASANYPELRILTIPQGEGPQPSPGFARLHEWSGWFNRHFRKGDWDVCSPKVARELSAIGYVFARRVHMASGVPIGVIDVSRGGTTVETWTPEAVLRDLYGTELRDKIADWDRRVAEWDPAADLANRVAQNERWIAQRKEQGQPIPEDRKEPPSDLRPGPIADHNYPGSCFAGMMTPLVGLSVKGVIFHQGYNNAFDGMTGVRVYETVFPAMIASWREAFGDPELPFGILSLCTDGYPQTRDDYLEKMLNTGIHIRAAQYRYFRDTYAGGDKNLGFASTFDLRRRWYHPQVKLPAGERIARWALSTQYGFGAALPWKPPALLSVEAKDGALFLKLDTEVSDPGDGAIEGFAIAGEDRQFQPAEVEYVQEGEDNRGRPRFNRKVLILTSPLISDPIHFRYAWGRNPMGNLQVSGNKDLPFATQRSDEWDDGSWPLGVLEGEFDELLSQKLSRAQRNRVIQRLRKEDEQRRLAEAKAVLDAIEGED